MEEIERQMPTSANAPAHSMAPTVITIPVVVHILYETAAQNISDAQIHSQIQVLNEDYRRKNADANNTPAEFLDVAADTEISFCLANVDPNGFTTNGITRTSTNIGTFSIDNQIKQSQLGGKDPWNTATYLNIWVGNLAGNLLGYAQFPGGNASTDGIVINYQNFGTTGTALAPFDLGRTATHEVGHWLNLLHIWGDGGCGVDDGVADTPLASGANVDSAPCVHPSKNSCTETTGVDLPDMFQNFMDYSDDACMNLFTVGQKLRMRSLFEINGARLSFLNAQGCNNSGIAADCGDGFANGDEVGVDCGGSSCAPCASLCGDGIQNGNELDIDCGGDCAPCLGGALEVCTNAVALRTSGTYTNPGPTSGFGANNSSAMHSNWYVMTPDYSGTLSIESCGGAVDTRLFLYEGACETLQKIAESDDDCKRSNSDFTPNGTASKILDFPITKGKTYYIEWDDRWSDQGFDFNISMTPIATCGDGIQNGTETAVDCGGKCFTCPTCSDGIQNGQETAVDCGGECSACPTCADGIQNGQETEIDCGGECTACPTCFDGIQNGQETDIDCGGECTACATCADGIQNGQETEIDCGGECTACATCADGIQNGQETDIDCGGECTACSTCSDGIQNGQETDIDCGGECTACATCFDGIQNGSETSIDCGGKCASCLNKMSFNSKNILTFSDPCYCENPQNCLVGNLLYFHDVMRIPSEGVLPTGLDIRVAEASNFYVAVPCSGGLLSTPIIGANGTRIVETSLGVYELNYWRPSGILPTFSVLEGGNVTTTPSTTFAPVCNQVDCMSERIPTMSEWGLLIFGLLIMNISVALLRRKERMIDRVR